ncbi:MAG TPA: hypothetical protein VJ455_09900 [Ignavibacteria bacterium]|nr:hypothetical protein [Ignavibacteria bacterium]
MTKGRKINKSNNIQQFIKEFSGLISAFESGIESVMDIISLSFDGTRKDAEDISLLFKSSRGEAELIFSIFSGIAGIFSGGGLGLLESLFSFLPGGNLLSTLFGGSINLPGGESVYSHSQIINNNENIYPAPVNNNPAPVVIVNTQLEKAGMYRVYREGKMISESRP